MSIDYAQIAVEVAVRRRSGVIPPMKRQGVAAFRKNLNSPLLSGELRKFKLKRRKI